MDSSMYMSKLWSFLIMVNNCLEKVLKPLTKTYGLTVSQLKIIYFTHKSGEATVGSVAEMAGFARTNTSSMCKKLVKMGFLQRKKNADDERYVKIALTSDGLAAANAIERVMCDYEDRSDAEQLRAATTILADILNNSKGK